MRRFYTIGFLTLFSCSTQANLDRILIDPSRPYEILHEDSLYDYYDEPTKITADLFVENCSSFSRMCEIKFSDAKLINDTLHLEISETNSVADYHYKIQVFEGRFKIKYWYQTTIDTSIRDVTTIKQRLVLDKRRFKKGDVIRGHTEYIGQCIEGCLEEEMQPIHISGDFKATVK
jgi:hypothetical protein